MAGTLVDMTQLMDDRATLKSALREWIFYSLEQADLGIDAKRWTLGQRVPARFLEMTSDDKVLDAMLSLGLPDAPKVYFYQARTLLNTLYGDAFRYERRQALQQLKQWESITTLEYNRLFSGEASDRQSTRSERGASSLETTMSQLELKDRTTDQPVFTDSGKRRAGENVAPPSPGSKRQRLAL